MKNRHGVKYSFDKVDGVTYYFNIPEKERDYMRFGTKEGQEDIDLLDLGFCDPSGGPFIEVGMLLEGRAITRIMDTPEGVFFEVTEEVV